MFFKIEAIRKNSAIYSLLFLGLLIRLIFSYIFKGHSDPWNLESYNEYLLDGQIPLGIPYLPSIYVFGYLCGIFVDYFGLFYPFWVKLTGILAEVGIMFLLFKIARGMGKSEKFSLFVCGAYIFNPLSFQLTAIQGQFDQHVFFFILLAVYIESLRAIRDKALPVALALVLATYFKPYAVLFFSAFFFRTGRLKDRMKFLSVYLLGCLLPILLLMDPLLIMRSIRSIIGYSGGAHLGWGVFLSDMAGFGEWVKFYGKAAKPLIITAGFIIGYIGRKRNILWVLLINILAVYMLSPFLASQYLYWAVPIGVIFINRFFCMYSVLGFIWQLNFFQYLIFEANEYSNYLQFVPLASLKALYNYWLYPEYFVRYFYFIAGGILIPLLMLVWLISLTAKAGKGASHGIVF